MTRTKSTTSTTRAAVYVRISMDREGAGLGVQRQEEDCRAYCAARGWDVAEVYVDNDVSATSSKPRPSWVRLLADIEAGSVDAIVVWHIDRMTRKPRELEDVIDIAEKSGIQLGTVTGDVDLSTPTGRMIARMLGAAARHEAEHKGERQRRQRQQAAEAGRPHKTGRRPFGYLDDFVTAHPVEAPFVADAARRVLAGESLGSVTRSLNELGVMTTMGKQWTYSGLRQILLTARISGRRETGATSSNRVGEIVALDCWDAIITPEQSDRLRTMLTSKTRPKGATTRKHLLSGLLSCSLCGASMAAGSRASAGKGPHTYRCNSIARRADGVTFGCGRVTVTRDNADKHVVDMVLTAIDSPELIERLRDREEVDPLLVEQVRRDEQELIDIASDRADGSITRGEWATMREKIDARLQLNKAKLARQTNTSSLSLLDGEGDMRERFAALNLGQKRAVISAVLETVRVAPAAPRSGCVFKIERLHPIWRV